MYAVSDAWKSVQSRYLAPEGFVEISCYIPQLLDTLVYTKNDIMSFTHQQTGSLVSGELPKNHIEFALDNSDGKWDPTNPTGMERYLSERLKITVRYGYNLNGVMEWIPGGVFYLSEWRTSSNGMEAHFTARDVLEYMIDKAYTGSIEGTLYQIAENAIATAGLPGDVVVRISNELKKYSVGAIEYDGKETVAQILQKCANAAGCVMFQDRNGVFRIEKIANSSWTSANTKISGQYTPVVTVESAAPDCIEGLSVYGKTTQAGTPTPGAPIALETVGSSGSVTVTVGEKPFSASTPNGLPGIPVSSGGNYTDANGQQWICDEIDFARGVYMCRIGSYTVTAEHVLSLTGTTALVQNTVNQFDYRHEPTVEMLSNRFVKVPAGNYSVVNANNLMTDGQFMHRYFAGGAGRMFFFKHSAFTDLAAAKAWFAANETVVIYPLAEPVETILGLDVWENPDGNFTVYSEGNLFLALADRLTYGDSGVIVPTLLSYTFPEIEFSRPLKNVKVTYDQDNEVLYQFSGSGETQTVDNDYIFTKDQAVEVSKWICDALRTRKQVSGEFRSDPRIDLYDTVTVESKYGSIDGVVLTNIKCSFTGAFRTVFTGYVRGSGTPVFVYSGDVFSGEVI